ncbi:isoprenyl transferase [Capnocytophaga cynodegmi]|uniref:Isoprenyl transferase n=1 Tax=Capnocytophaga cynodegmi TaxID=28189 RepID=A0A0B7H562_9FLAO|nr:isoprenyl transferase [Capnocytophaga cynodegmi]ATA68971.1 di-trans,poly-cis-decaprenylcistransferase [Capnocytophaga cynodegmi]CEN34736.1 undecaprenyl pyrophosphate synthase [Capnocytophaga cynodegmi]CEN38914.1 undecaprenyl pyrophosphate synthase [Capnocytophaga cynodegmi]
MEEIINYPKHLAIIMDGNGRWAKKQGMMRIFGHESAMKAVRETVEYCVENHISYLTLYAFSTENWNRPAIEVNALMELLIKFLKKESKSLNENNIRLKTIGRLDHFPKKAKETLLETIDKLKDNTGVTLTLALGYGAREELSTAVKNIAEAVKNGLISTENINESVINSYLYTSDLPDVDLLIRTSGEYRISNFLLWQIAYSELYFTDVLWPDFNKNHLNEAILNYQKRERRFGKTSEQLR